MAKLIFSVGSKSLTFDNNDFVVFIDAANLEQSVKKMHVVPQDIPDSLRGHEAGALRWSVA